MQTRFQAHGFQFKKIRYIIRKAHTQKPICRPKRDISKKQFYYPTNTSSTLCISKGTCPEILFRDENLCEVNIYTINGPPCVKLDERKNRGKPDNYFETRYAHIDANAAVNVTNSVSKIARVLIAGALECI